MFVERVGRIKEHWRDNMLNEGAIMYDRATYGKIKMTEIVHTGLWLGMFERGSMRDQRCPHDYL